MIGAVITWLATSKVGRALAAGLGIAAAIGLAVAKVFSAGKAAEQAKQQRQSLDNLRERAKKNDEIRTLTGDDLRERLNRWVPDNDER